MKKRTLTAMIMSAMIAASAMSVSVSAQANIRDYIMSPPYMMAITQTGESEWTITEEGVGYIKEDIEAGGGLYELNVTLFEDYSDSMVLEFNFSVGDKSYELPFIMMKAEKEMHIPVIDIINALNDRYPKETIDYDDLTSVTVTDGAGLVNLVYFSGNEEFPLLAGNVFAAYSADENGDYTKLSGYWVFDSDGKNGHSLNRDKIMGIGFAYEQDGSDFVFHMGAADDNTPAVFEFRDGGLFADIQYGENGEYARTLKFSILAAEDPDTFGDTEAEFGLVEVDDNKWQLRDAAETLMNANGTAGGNVGIALTFDAPLDNGFDLTFEFTMNDGTVKTAKAAYGDALANDTVFVKVRDLINESGINVQDVAEFAVINNGSDEINAAVMGMSPEGAVGITFPKKTATIDSTEDQNPKTGVSIALSAILAAASGALGVAFRKRK